MGFRMHIELKRAYQAPADADGFRVLVDRIWPRGVSKEQLRLDDWLKDVAPSDELRKWFGHDSEKWHEFVRRYHEELNNQKGLVEDLLAKARVGGITLVFAAKDEEHNNAVALKKYLEKAEILNRSNLIR